MYMAYLLQALGLDVRHEAVGYDGAVSWREQTGKPFSIRVNTVADERIPIEFEHVFHQVRNPLHTIASIRTISPQAWRYASKHVAIPPGSGSDSTLKRAMWLWHGWNLRCERQAEWTYRIEAIDDVFDELCSRLGIRAARHVLRGMPRSINSREHMTVGWAELFAEDPDVAREILDMATRYGYEFRLEDDSAIVRRRGCSNVAR